MPGMRTFPLFALAWLAAFVTPCGAAPLDVTPDTLIERAALLRDARSRPWEPTAGRLGNLRFVYLVAPGCVVRVTSGPENRVYPGSQPVQVDETHGSGKPAGAQGHAVRAVKITPGGMQALPRLADRTGPECLTLQLATAHELLLGGDRMAVLFDRVELPALRVTLNPSASLRLWFEDARIGLLGIHSNAHVLAGGTGQVEWLQLSASQRATSLLFHDMAARHIGASALTTHVRFSVRITPETAAGYYQPARAPGKLAELYPIWIDGPLAALKVPAGSVYPMPLTPALRDETRGLRNDLLREAGPSPARAAGAPDQAVPAGAEPVSPRQRVSDALQPLLPARMQIGKVDLWKDGAALEGRAPDEATVREGVQRLLQAGDVRHAQVALIRRDAGPDAVGFRVLVTLACSAPGEPSVCLPVPGTAYTAAQVQAALEPITGPEAPITRLDLRADGTVLLEGTGDDAQARAALDRIQRQAPWLAGGSSTYGKGRYAATLRMACKAPPQPGGLCAVPQR